MELSEILVLIVGLIVTGVGVYQVRQSGAKINSPSQALDKFWQAKELVETYAPAADQLVKLNELAKGDRLEYVIDLVFDYVKGLRYDQVRGIVEGWVAEQKKQQPVYPTVSVHNPIGYSGMDN